MKCPHCQSDAVRPRSRLTKQGYKTYICGGCHRSFNERTGSAFNNTQYPSDIIFLVVLWRLRYKLSLRDLSEMMLMRGFEITHQTVRDWEKRFAPMLAVQLKSKRRGQASKQWHVDETVIRVKNQYFYLYRAVDRHGNLVDARLSRRRDLAATQQFFKEAVKAVGHKPTKVTTDKYSGYPKAISRELGRKVEHRTVQYLNNVMEQDHRGIKGRVYSMRGFKSFDSAARFCEAYDEQRNYFRYRQYCHETVSLHRQRWLFRGRFLQLKHAFLAA